ncbi:MAG TPA: hypothetical protein VGL25_14275 [Casimicrobiaceae bacterium]
MKIGIAGTGRMGTAMALRLIACAAGSKWGESAKVLPSRSMPMKSVPPMYIGSSKNGIG